MQKIIVVWGGIYGVTHPNNTLAKVWFFNAYRDASPPTTKKRRKKAQAPSRMTSPTRGVSPQPSRTAPTNLTTVKINKKVWNSSVAPLYFCKTRIICHCVAHPYIISVVGTLVVKQIESNLIPPSDSPKPRPIPQSSRANAANTTLRIVA